MKIYVKNGPNYAKNSINGMLSWGVWVDGGEDGWIFEEGHDEISKRNVAIIMEVMLCKNMKIPTREDF